MKKPSIISGKKTVFFIFSWSLLLWGLFSTDCSFAQTKNSDQRMIIHAMDSLNISLNRPSIPNGYRLYYNCDSMAFFKKVYSDTISILTPGSYTPMTWYPEAYSISTFKNWLSKDRYLFPPSFPTSFSEDGRINVASYSETVFVFRNDSLFMRYSDYSAFIDVLFNSVDLMMQGKIDSLKLDSVLDIADKNNPPVITWGFIFTKDMFVKNDTVVLSPQLNPENVWIVLQKHWKDNGLECFNILIESIEEEDRTRVSYTFDEKMKFLLWEGCNKIR